MSFELPVSWRVGVLALKRAEHYRIHYSSDKVMILLPVDHLH